MNNLEAMRSWLLAKGIYVRWISDANDQDVLFVNNEDCLKSMQPTVVAMARRLFLKIDVADKGVIFSA